MIIKDIIKEAYRVNNIIGFNQIPNDDELSEGLSILKMIYFELFGNTIGGNLVDIPFITKPIKENELPSPYTKQKEHNGVYPSNSRIIVYLENTSNNSIYFPNNPSPGARMGILLYPDSQSVHVHGNSRMIDGLWDFEIKNTGAAKEWWYRDDIGQWESIPLINFYDVNYDELKFPFEYINYFIHTLAIYLSERHSITPNKFSVLLAKSYSDSMKTRYMQGRQVKQKGQC